MIWMAALAVVLLAGCTDAGVPDGPGPDAGRTNDAGVAVADVPVGPDGGSDAGGPVDDCTARCLDTQMRCGGSEIDCGRLCATYQSDLVAGCEAERDTYFSCGFDGTCGGCSTEEDALAACIFERSTNPCFVACRAANAAGCGYGHGPEGRRDCNCIAAYYNGDLTRCVMQVGTYFACEANHPCDHNACAIESATLGGCRAGCAPGEIACDSCADPSTLMTDNANCGRCGNDCGDLGTCVAGTCECAGGSQYCDRYGCVTDDVMHCGTSCASCATPDHGVAVCDAGTCGIVCDAGFIAEGGLCVRDCGAGRHLCGDACYADDDPTACGDSCAVCPTPDHGRAACAAGACDIVCDPAFVRMGSMCVGAGPVSMPCMATGACDPFESTSCGPGRACRPEPGGTACGPVSAMPVREGGACSTVANCEAGTQCLDFSDGVGYRCHRLCPQGSIGFCAVGDACSGSIGDACVRACRPLAERCDIYAQDCPDPADTCTLATNLETDEHYTGCHPAGSRLHGETCGGSSGSCDHSMICVRDAGATTSTCRWVCDGFCPEAGEACTGRLTSWPGVQYCH
ncbi:hypothetical protein EPO33_05155 [Patescibacteria group bacterium]|nr:MAG: hypothetical protein EPO33_05155 [Patescibacteria group bacterium]